MFWGFECASSGKWFHRMTFLKEKKQMFIIHPSNILLTINQNN